MNKKFIPNPKEIEALVKLSEESLASAKLRLKEKFLRGAVSDSYYAAFYIAKAALLKKGFISKTHTGTVRLFGEKFIKTGKVNKEYGQWLHQLLEERIEADYEALHDFDYKETKEAVIKAEGFIEEVKKVV